MKLKYCSITGADDAVDPKDLVKLSQEFPHAEWAILLLPARYGQPRFPTAEWIKKFTEETKGKNIHAAMHLCDEALLGFIEGKKEILDLMKGFQRIQLNLKFGNVEGKYDPQKLVERVKESPQWEFIIQYTPEKQGLLPLLKDTPNHAVLFDASAGRGIRPEKWDHPLPGHFCGQAGGLGPHNLETELKAIAKAMPDYTTWVDMETGVRSGDKEDKFVLAKARGALEITAPYVLKPAAPAMAAGSNKPGNCGSCC